MTYRESMRAQQLRIIVEAIREAQGNCCLAADNLKIHRNMITRVLKGAGYRAADVRRGLQVRYRTAG